MINLKPHLDMGVSKMGTFTLAGYVSDKPLKIKRCGNCRYAGATEPFCYNVEGDNNGHETEISNNFVCGNWEGEKPSHNCMMCGEYAPLPIDYMGDVAHMECICEFEKEYNAYLDDIAQEIGLAYYESGAHDERGC